MRLGGSAVASSPERRAAKAENESSVRAITALGLPFLLGALSSSLSGVVDTAMMGHYGSAELAAVSGASAVFDIFAATVLASVTGFQILAARFAGRRDPAGIRIAMRASARFSGAIAVGLTLLCMAAGGWLTGLVSDGHADLRSIGSRYLIARGPTLLLLVPYTLLTSTFNAYKKPRFALVAGIVVNLINLLLDWLLIYGPGPLPRLGATGNGLATTLSWLVGLGCMLVAARRFELRRMLAAPAPAPNAGPSAGPVAGPVDFVTSVPRLSWPAIASMSLDYASLAIFFTIIGAVGEDALGGGRIAFQLLVLIYGTGTAFSAAARILIGRAAGAGQFAQFGPLWRASLRMLLPPAVVICAVLILAPRPVALLFTSSTPVIDAAAKAIPLVGLCVPLVGWTLGNLSVLRALGKTKADMYTNLTAALVVQLPVGWLFAIGLHDGVAGAFAGVLTYWAVRAVLTADLARRAVRDEKQRKLGPDTPAKERIAA